MPHAIAQCFSFIKKYCPKATFTMHPSTAGSIPLMNALNLPDESTIVIGHKNISNFFDIHIEKKI